jgi:uncharacterized protein (TIGR03435 family)
MRNRAELRGLFLVTAGVVALAVPLIVGVLTAPLGAQSPAAQSSATAAPAPQSLEAIEAADVKMSFDVASVKPNQSGGRAYSNVPLAPGGVFPPNGGLFSAANNPLLAYIGFAYDLTIDQLLHLRPQLPTWATTDKFDIEARTRGNPTKAQMQLMMQSLLAERFKLVAHTATKQGPVYALVLSKPGKTGPQLQPDAEPCSAEPLGPGRQPPAPSAPSSASGMPLSTTPCGIALGVGASVPGRRRLVGRGVTIGLIAIYVTNSLVGVDRPVVDRTGLSGNFDFSIEFTPETNGPPSPDFQPDATGPTFLEALQDQLGLKLEPTTGPVSAFVVDHAERPSPN